ncbi:hypothetical protein H0H93_000280 [Arthromyces matolae]|nr:hypothetical protein H0H93_000280 [Arthromyces matolae]
MVSLLRTVRSLQRVGLREWWRQMQYIGDAKSGTYVGKDQFPWVENLTGTRGAYRPYNTVSPKISAWEPKINSRS